MPAVTRIGDLDIVHCSPMVRAQGSGSVYVNYRGWSLQSYVNTVHHRPVPSGGCFAHVGPIAIGSTTVKIHGLGGGRVGDYISSCTFVAEGSSNVFAGG